MKKILLIASLVAIITNAEAQVLLSEDFQSGIMPATWTVQQSNTNETWHVEDPLEGTDYKATVNYDDALGAQNELLISPAFNLPAGESYTLKADIALSYAWAVAPNNNYDAFIKVSTDNGTTWTQVWSENELGTFISWVNNLVSIDLTPYAGNANVKVAFQYTGTDGAALYVDNVVVEKYIPPTSYCGPLDFTSNVEPITLVNFAGINNVTAPTINETPDHEDFTSIIGHVEKGNSYDITLKGNTDGDFTNRFAVFIDWNQDFDFNDAGEIIEITQTIFNSTGVDGIQAVQSIVVPTNALAGNTRMRVKKIFGTTNYLNPCLATAFGQVEDYTLNIANLAVSDVAKNSVKVYPNPVVDVMNVESAAKVKSVSVYDAAGKLVSSNVMNAVKSPVNLSKLSAGVYVVTIETENGTQSVKIIKK